MYVCLRCRLTLFCNLLRRIKIKMWGLHSPRILFDWSSPWNSSQKEENDSMQLHSTMDMFYNRNRIGPLRTSPNFQTKNSKMHSHNSSTCYYFSTGRPEPFLCRKVRTRSSPTSSITLYIVVILVCLVFENSIIVSSSAEPIVPRIVRSSLIRPTRVTYGDIEKTNKTCAPKDTCAPSRNGKKVNFLVLKQ